MTTHAHSRLIQIIPAPAGLVVRGLEAAQYVDQGHPETWDDPVIALGLYETWQCADYDCDGPETCDNAHPDKDRRVQPITITLDGDTHIDDWVTPSAEGSIGFAGTEQLESAIAYRRTNRDRQPPQPTA